VSLFLFWAFAALMLAFGMGIVLHRDPVSSAMCLVMSFVGLSALFFMLDAYFIGIIQILVYAGAVMVLFLFIIMLLDLRAERARSVNIPAWIGGLSVLVGFLAILARVIRSSADFTITKPALASPNTDDVSNIGATLFTSFNLPFQIIGVLLLVATVGVVILSKRELK